MQHQKSLSSAANIFRAIIWYSLKYKINYSEFSMPCVVTIATDKQTNYSTNKLESAIWTRINHLCLALLKCYATWFNFLLRCMQHIYRIIGHSYDIFTSCTKISRAWHKCECLWGQFYFIFLFRLIVTLLAKSVCYTE